LLSDLFGVAVAIAAIGLLTFASGLVVLVRMHETLHRHPVAEASPAVAAEVADPAATSS
jgi:hypothetical protein